MCFLDEILCQNLRARAKAVLEGNFQLWIKLFTKLKASKTGELSMHFKSWKWARKHPPQKKEYNKSEGRYENQWNKEQQ